MHVCMVAFDAVITTMNHAAILQDVGRAETKHMEKVSKKKSKSSDNISDKQITQTDHTNLHYLFTLCTTADSVGDWHPLGGPYKL